MRLERFSKSCSEPRASARANLPCEQTFAVREMSHKKMGSVLERRINICHEPEAAVGLNPPDPPGLVAQYEPVNA
ncbi:MAG: hypothetical protein ACYTFA_03065 [Planctomycetota bacterium]